MSQYLTSSETLERLCEIQPDHPIKYGIGNSLAGIGLVGVSAGTGWMGWLTKDIIPYDPIIDGIVITLEVILGSITLASGGYGLYLLADGITSFGKTIGLTSDDGNIYYRNGGFTKNPTFSDKKFGTKVVSAEHKNELRYHKNELTLVNGVSVAHTNIKPDHGIRLMHVNTGNSDNLIPIPYTNYRITMHGEFNGQPLDFYSVTEDGAFAESVANLKSRSIIYAMGQVNRGKTFELTQFGKAFTK